MRLIYAAALIVSLAAFTQAQDERGWSFSGSFSGSSNSDGLVTKAQPLLDYTFNHHFSTYTGIPFYFVHMSSTTTPTTTTPTTTTTGNFMGGVGNAILGFRADVNNDLIDYRSTLEFTAPTDDESRGFSTGRVTADWTNRFSHRVSSVTPFGSVGFANTVSDTAFFVRPFTSLGLVGHFEGGATYDVVSSLVQVGASAYAVRGSGDQTIVSKVANRKSGSTSTSTTPTTSGNGNGKSQVFNIPTQKATASIVDDHGYSAWLGVSPTREVDFHAGYSRSVNYDFNTFFFGVGFHVGK
jgi:hypothetical protein